MDLPDILQNQYDPTDVEDEIYNRWEESGFFNPEACVEEGVINEDAESFSMVLPPPNVTGQLHLGHAFEDSLQDIVVRYNRMKGKRTLWIPGTDHAAIATQAKVEKQLHEEEGKDRYDLGREDFLKQVKEFAQESHDTIVSQIKKMGASVDWSREAYTLDDEREIAVRTAFKELYEKGLIYRDSRVVNWDPKGQTTVSDDEVEHEETTGTLYTFRYSDDFPIPIATTRPETKVGDTAVAVHPDDDRYSEYIGETFEVEFVGVPLEIEVIADKEIDSEFGTGAVGLTPAHSKTDWEIARRHDLELKQVINEDAEMINVSDELEGKSTDEAREYIARWLEEEDLLEDTEETEMQLSTADRSGGVIEPLPKLQWFINVEKPFELEHSNIDGIESGEETTLKEIMRTTVESGQIDVIPDRFEKVYFHWIDKLRDWCISRQIWYGHRIPVWYRNKSEIRNPKSEIDDENIHVGIEPPEGDEWHQDPDTLDTWFSSGLWTFSTLGWPEETEDLKTYHPTSFINPGYEILFFWVARMVLMSGSLLGEIPFKTVYLHGIVRDSEGRKFSKSLGNGIDPIEVIEEYGADALRMGLVVGVGPGNDSSFDMEEVEGYKHFANKIWNASKFVMMNLPEDYTHEKPDELSEQDEKRLEELNETIQEITKNMEKNYFHIAAEDMYHYFWHTFADEILEENKERIYGDDEEAEKRAQWILYEVLTSSLKMLHPFMPFVTEEIWSHLPGTESDLLMVASWPESNNQTE